MSTVIAKNVQIGTSGTATDNFTIFQLATPDGTLRIGNGNTGITTSQVALTSAGNVGIGTSAPKTKLQSTAGTNLNAPSLGSATNAPLYFTNTDSAYGLLAGVSAGDGHAWFQAQRTDGTATAYNITLNEAGGNVGIGINAPTLNTNGTVLHINNSTASRAAILHCTNAESGSTGADGLIVGKWSDGTNYFFDYDSYPLVFGNAATNRMVIDTSGNVGIGTSSPGHKLQVNGNIVSTDGTTTVRMVTSGGVGLVSTLTNHPLAFQTNDAEQARITTAGLFQFNSGYGSVATAYGCRAWINFNGTGTPAIRGSGNFSSITDNGTGDYTLNFTTSLPDTNYCPVVGGDFSQGATRDNGMYLPTNFTFATSSLRISVTNYAGAYTDIDTVLVSIFR